MNKRLAELIDEARGVIAKMEPELNSLNNGDNFRVCTKLKSIQYNLSNIMEIVDGKDGPD